MRESHADSPEADHQRGERGDNHHYGADHKLQEEEHEIAIVSQAHAVAHERAMVVHPRHAASADLAVMAPRRLRPLTDRAAPRQHGAAGEAARTKAAPP